MTMNNTTAINLLPALIYASSIPVVCLVLYTMNFESRLDLPALEMDSIDVWDRDIVAPIYIYGRVKSRPNELAPAINNKDSDDHTKGLMLTLATNFLPYEVVPQFLLPRNYTLLSPQIPLGFSHMIRYSSTKTFFSYWEEEGTIGRIKVIK